MEYGRTGAAVAAKKTGNRGFFVVLFLVSLCFWAFVFSLSPMTEDDNYFWSLRLQGLEEIWNFAFCYGNGRLLGNLGVFYLVEYKLLRVLVKALSLTALVFLLPPTLGLKERRSYIWSFLLLAGISPAMFAQVYVWTSGFQNYVPAVLLFLLGLTLIRRAAETGKGRLAFCPLLLLLGFAMELYVEHSSALNLMLCALLVLYAAVARRELLPMTVCFLMGAAAGFALMMRLPSLASHTIVDMSIYKNVVSGGVAAVALRAIKNGIVLAARYTEFVPAFLVLAGIQSLLLYRARERIGRRQAYLLSGGLLLPAALFALCHGASLGDWYGRAAVGESLLLALALCVFLVSLVIGAALLLRGDGGRTLRPAYGLVLLALAALLPLALISPVVCRMSFHSCVFLAGAILLLLEQCSGWEKLLERGGCLLLAVLLLWLGVLFADIARIAEIREDYIAAQLSAGEETADYFLHPSEYVFEYWDSIIYSQSYSALYGQPVQLELLSAEQWFVEHYY